MQNENEESVQEELLDLRLRIASLERELDARSTQVAVGEALLDATYRSRAWRYAERLLWLPGKLGPAGAVATGVSGLGAQGVRVAISALPVDGAHGTPPAWTDAITVGGVTLGGAALDPPASLRYRVRSAPGAVLRTFVALRPAAWHLNRGGVRFSVHVREPGGTVRSEVSREVHPASRASDRRWLPLLVELGGEGELIIELVTEVPPGAWPDFAWALWGDPVILVPGPQESVVTLPSLRSRRWSRPRKRAATRGAGPSVSFLLPVHDPDPGNLRETLASVFEQSDSDWTLCITDDGSSDPRVVAILDEVAQDRRVTLARHPQALGISAATNTALAQARGEFVATLDHDDLLTPDALASVRAALGDGDVLYSDNDKVGPGGARFSAALKPDWSPELLRACMYTLHLGVYRRSLVEQIGGWRPAFDGAQDHDLMLRLSEHTERIAHLPRTLYSWRAHAGSAALSDDAKPQASRRGAAAITEHLARIGVDAQAQTQAIAGRYRVVYNVDPSCSVSIVAPSVASVGPEHAGLWESVEVVNHVDQASGDVLVLLSEPCVPLTGDWIAELVGPLSLAGVVATSPLVVDDEDRVVHAGIALLGGLPLGVHVGAPTGGDEVADELTMVCDRSGANGVVALYRDRLVEVSQFDRLALADLTLGLTRSGGRVVCSPHAPWRRIGEGVSIDLDEYRRFALRHRGRRDPFYNPRLWQDRAAYDVGSAARDTPLLGDPR